MDLKVKIFQGAPQVIQQQINHWLETDDSIYDVEEIRQSGSGQTTTISVWYEEVE